MNEFERLPADRGIYLVADEQNEDKVPQDGGRRPREKKVVCAYIFSKF